MTNLLPGQITLDEAQIERGERREGGVEYDPSGNEVQVLKVPPGYGTFKDPREAVRASQAARGHAASFAAAYGSMAPSRPSADILPWEGHVDALMTPSQLMTAIRRKGDW